MRRFPHARRDHQIHAGPPEQDRGTTIIEILIAIVLIGGVIGGTMATLRATTIAGVLHRDHSNAHGWMQSASDILYAAPKVSCDTTLPNNGEAAVRASYDAIVDAVPHPQGWNNWQIRVVPSVQFWNSGNLDADPDIEYFFGPGCEAGLDLQLVQIEVRNTNGRIIENVEIVK